MMILHVTYKMKPAQGKSFVDAIEKAGIGAAVRAEDGCFRYDYFFPATGADEVLLVEKWRDEEALAVHLQQPHMADLNVLKEQYALDVMIEKFKVCE